MSKQIGVELTQQSRRKISSDNNPSQNHNYERIISQTYINVCNLIRKVFYNKIIDRYLSKSRY